MNRLEAPLRAAAPTPESPLRRRPRLAAAAAAPGGGGIIVVALAGLIAVAAGGYATWRNRIDWNAAIALVWNITRIEPTAARAALPVAREMPLPLPRRGEETLARARALAAAGHLHEALVLLDQVRRTDPQIADADRLRGDIQRQLLTLSDQTTAGSSDRENGERRRP